ncbi:DUF3253 domain-containing protein [Luteimonas sp. 100069]|uniref:DUF3253 domain-containing protein n=1 Tax=Luteimonas sp. 100069 TaxID=2006109 RepID=UPI000F4EB06E|nr:DUF3253 domain-containing protein [Luteimonas sp. 100069]RPD85367.1 DUF3253 domain-containing protein [Luteimonas sp. 100069]
MPAVGDATIAAAIRALLAARGPAASICPSEVARRLPADANWRDAMPEVRRVARALAQAGEIVITRGEAALDPAAPLSGPIRLRRGPRADTGGAGR